MTNPPSTPASDAQNALTDWVILHPVRWGLVSGALVVLLIAVLNRLPLTVALLVAVPVGVGNWFGWREGGPAPRLRAYILRRFPKKK